MSTMAHFSGTCPDCGERWQPGDLIRAQAIPPGESPIWKHATCPAPTLDLDRLGPTDSELESPTPLAEQIAREHTLHTVWPERCSCSCGATLDFPDGTPSTDFRYAHAAHIATVTERAVRERMRAAGPTLEIHAWGATPEQADAIFTAAMDAAWDAAPEGVAVDAVGKLAGKTARGATDD